VRQTRHPGECPLVPYDFLVRREHDGFAIPHAQTRGLGEGSPPFGARDDVGGAGDVGELLDGLAVVQAMGYLDDGALGHTEHQKMRLGVQDDGPTNGVGPVVIVGQAPEGSLDASQDDGQTRKGLPAEIGVDYRGPIRAKARTAAGAIFIARSNLLLSGELVEHGVEVACADPDEQARAPHARDVLRGVPAGLGHDTHAVAVVLEPPGDESRAEGWVVHVSVTGDEQDVEGIPSQRFKVTAGRGEEATGREGAHAGARMARGQGKSKGKARRPNIFTRAILTIIFARVLLPHPSTEDSWKPNEPTRLFLAWSGS
jgi:hypothetical protein